ncbi:MAG: hypothetical protein LBH98_04250 [Chitinispirillales bacterium]|jgi:hypothetical protein|nr:hypothetical protein [Chitinispirillales bacterium]
MRKVFFVFNLLFLMLNAQTPKIALSKDSLALGESCTMSVYFKEENIKSIAILNPSEWLGGVRFHDVKEIFSQNERIFEIITSFYETPVCTIPEISFLVEKSDGARDTVKTEIRVVRVPSIFEKLDTNQLKKIKTLGLPDPMSAGKLSFLYIIIAALAICFAFLIAKYILRKNKKSKILNIPPFEEAVAELENLDKLELIEKGEFKRFVFSISIILKRYVSRRYDVSIEEATSTEFKQWLRKSELDREDKIILEKFINETDPVKFADFIPSAAIVKELRAVVGEFVNRTRPIENPT